jgi:hypothetical protein
MEPLNSEREEQEMDLRGLSSKAKELIEKRGGTDSLKQDAEQLKGVAKGSGSLSEKAKAAVSALKDPGADAAAPETTAAPTADAAAPTERARAEGKLEGEGRGKHRRAGGGQGRGRGGGGRGRGRRQGGGDGEA